MYRRTSESLWAKLSTPVLIILCLIGIFGKIWISGRVRSTEYEIGRLEDKRAVAISESRRLEFELESALDIAQRQERGIALRQADRSTKVIVRRDAGHGYYSAAAGRPQHER